MQDRPSGPAPAVAAATLASALLLGTPALASAQQAPDSCDSPECCSEARGAELYGRVLSAESGDPLPGATIAFRITAPPGGGATSSRRVETDGSGSYRLCGIPTPASVEARAERSGATSRSVSFRLDGPNRLELSFEIRGVPAGLDSLREAAATAETKWGPGRIVGRIADAGTGRPVPEATVTLRPAGRQVLTDSEGRFEIRDAPAGAAALAIHHIAYGDQEVDVDVPSGLTVDLDIDLPPEAVEVEPIDVRVDATVQDPYLEDRGYYERKRRGELLGMGGFLDGPELQVRGARASHVLSTMPGLRTMSGQLSGFVHFNRYRNSLHGGPCLPAVYVDGHKVAGSAVYGGGGGVRGFVDYYRKRLGGRHGLNTLVSPASLAAVEVYEGPASTAGEFQGSDSRCGVIALWTRHGPGPRADGGP